MNFEVNKSLFQLYSFPLFAFRNLTDFLICFNLSFFIHEVICTVDVLACIGIVGKGLISPSTFLGAVLIIKLITNRLTEGKEKILTHTHRGHIEMGPKKWPKQLLYILDKQ